MVYGQLGKLHTTDLILESKLFSKKSSGLLTIKNADRSSVKQYSFDGMLKFILLFNYGIIWPLLIPHYANKPIISFKLQ